MYFHILIFNSGTNEEVLGLVQSYYIWFYFVIILTAPLGYSMTEFEQGLSLAHVQWNRLIWYLTEHSSVPMIVKQALKLVVEVKCFRFPEGIMSFPSLMQARGEHAAVMNLWGK